MCVAMGPLNQRDQAGRDKWKKMKENFSFSRDSDAPFAPKSEDSRFVWGQN